MTDARDRRGIWLVAGLFLLFAGFVVWDQINAQSDPRRSPETEGGTSPHVEQTEPDRRTPDSRKSTGSHRKEEESAAHSGPPGIM